MSAGGGALLQRDEARLPPAENQDCAPAGMLLCGAGAAPLLCPRNLDHLRRLNAASGRPLLLSRVRSVFSGTSRTFQSLLICGIFHIL